MFQSGGRIKPSSMFVSKITWQMVDLNTWVRKILDDDDDGDKDDMRIP